MSDIHAVLLVPAEGDPVGLLREGPCGARPPTVNRGRATPDGPEVWAWEWPASGFYSRTGEAIQYALALGWDGEPVRRGALWVEVMLAEMDCDEVPSWRLLVNRVSRAMVERQPAAANMLRRLLGDLGTLVLLDAEGREVSDE